MRQSRRKKKEDGNFIVGMILFCIVVVFVASLYRASAAALVFLNSKNGHQVLWMSGLLFIGFISRKLFSANKKRKYARHLKAKIESLLPSIDREDYIISDLDYHRGNQKESYYRKVFNLRLLESFGNSCAKCGRNDNGITIDHFIFSKNEGGCFMMWHKENYLVNNAIPLCQSCNSRKSDKSYKYFFNQSELLTIFEANISLTKLLNEKPILNCNGKIIGKPKIRRSS